MANSTHWDVSEDLADLDTIQRAIHAHAHLDGGGPQTMDITAPPMGLAVCASLRHQERIDRRFLALQVTLLSVLSIAAVLLLLVGVWLTIIGGAAPRIAGITSVAGALVSGVVARNVNKQRQASLDMLSGVLDRMQANNCPASPEE